MAYAALVSLSRTIEQFLNHDEYSISLPQKQHMISIHEYVIFLQVFLEDVPHEVDNTLGGRIRDAANQAEDVIEYFTWRQIQSRYPLIKSKITKLNEVRFQDDHPKRNLYRDYSELDQVVELMGIMNQSRFKEMKLGDSGVVASSSSSRTSPSYKNDATMVGLNDDLLAIKERLCGEASKLQVIPIVGMGGIGKTALATNAYLDPLIIEHFHIRAWVTVSQDYSAQRIVSDLLSCMKEFNTERSYQSNEEKVYKALKGRKYLIVMNDMWSTQAWDDVRRIFPDDDNGSRILLTTRRSDVAAYADSCSHLHEMHLMDSDQSWDLLRQKVFKQEELCPLELEDTGKGIARSCIGLPLAIVVIAGLLSWVSKTRASWEKNAENVTSTIATENGQLEKIMSLSYTHLPHHLRPCFLYMGAFPEDHVIHVSKLVKLWVAEGFLKYPSGSKSLEEEVAKEYFGGTCEEKSCFGLQEKV